MYENGVSPSSIEARNVVESFVRAVEYVPTKRDSRSNKPPTLEPHYKLVSIVHKLVQRKALSPSEGSDVLQTTHFARRIPKSTEVDNWDEYVLQILKALRKADEANWHHRMILRAAHVIYDECQENDMAAMAAKHELTQQVFTKTMAASVWRPEHERVGRHFVYTSRYVRFFMRLLLQLADKANMELLVRRVRRKTAEFFEHAKLWQDVCGAYLKVRHIVLSITDHKLLTCSQLLRRIGKIPEGHEDAIFKNLNHDEFALRSLHLEAWCHKHLGDETENTQLATLKDIVELKKINYNMIKPTLIDDLIGDTYALLYADVGSTLDDYPLLPYLEQQIPAHLQSHQRQQSNAMSLDNFMHVDSGGDQQRSACLSGFNLVPTALHDAATSSKPRNKGVGRRELQKKAEAAVTKPLATSLVHVRNTPQNNVQVVIPARPTHAPTMTLTPWAPHPIAGAPPPLQQLEGSAPSSVDDDADDESGSELSELDDEIVVQRPPQLMFPNLVPHGGGPGEDERADTSADVEAEQGEDGLEDVVDETVERDEGGGGDQRMEDAE